MRLSVGRGSCGIAAGADEALNILNEAGLEAGTVGCIGLCYLEPIVSLDGELYVKVNKEGAAEIAKAAKGQDNNAKDWLISEGDKAVLAGQQRIALRNCGIINPEELEAYGLYRAYEKALTMSPEAVIEALKTSGLGGRGGAGFPTWFKWDACRKSAGDKKYIICNADEGDPGAFMDRALIEGDPHALIEGMMIAAYAIGHPSAHVEGIVYARAEYPLAITRLGRAIGQARAAGYLNDSFDIRIKEGAGAFVCGEETALIASIEGERGMPRLKPPFPAQSGLWGLPTNINNVETYANVPYIILNGPERFAEIGTESSKGTKVFALTGKIKNGGLVEIPMGRSLREVIYGPGGGVRGGKAFKAVQMGGPSGGCIPESLLDTLIDYKALTATGAIMGSGGMVVMDEDTCMVDMARFFLDFICKESCGKCVHCRIGTKRMLEILIRITEGGGEEGDIERLLELGQQIKDGALCGLGQTASNPVLTTIRYFRNEYEDHIAHKKCTAHSCKALIHYEINRDRCVACGLCRKACPAGAVQGAPKVAHSIDQDKCVKCGKCMESCRFGAVLIN
ncbi:MAG: 4Fe-4S binding protein [Clostridiales bacterium]|jgi:NADH-quinone oxidoreductase subunit F|nr:4Fe-4S binding protein [Clostridiales bacterium]